MAAEEIRGCVERARTGVAYRADAVTAGRSAKVPLTIQRDGRGGRCGEPFCRYFAHAVDQDDALAEEWGTFAALGEALRARIGMYTDPPPAEVFAGEKTRLTRYDYGPFEYLDLLHPGLARLRRASGAPDSCVGDRGLDDWPPWQELVQTVRGAGFDGVIGLPSAITDEVRSLFVPRPLLGSMRRGRSAKWLIPMSVVLHVLGEEQVEAPPAGMRIRSARGSA